MSAAEQTTSRWTGVSGLRLLCFIIFAASIAAVWLHSPYLAIELPRLEWWKIAGLYFSDAIAFLWFLRFALVHGVLARPRDSASFLARRRGFKVFVTVGTVALLIDLGFTVFLLQDEKICYDHGVVTSAEIVAKRVRTRAVATWYELDCRFQDHSGAQRRAHVRLEVQNHIDPPSLPPETLRSVRMPFQPGQTIPLRYDPAFPTRAWIDGLGSEDGDRIYGFSLLTLFFQAILTALFFLLTKQNARLSTSPWWWDIYKTLPLAVEVFWVLTLGLIDKMMDKIT